MVQVYTNLVTRESARKQRFEPTGNVTATSVQKAIQQVDTEAAGKVAQVGTARLPAQSSTVAINSTDIEVGINTTSSAVTCPLPSVASWSATNPNGLELTIFDATGHAATNNISFTLNGTDTFLDGTTPQITGNFGLIKLRPVLGSPNSWYIRAIN